MQFVLDPYIWWGKTTRTAGALVGKPGETAAIALAQIKNGYYNAVGAGTGNCVVDLQASATTGTGYGVYKAGAHVRPNSACLCYWKRFQ